MVGNILAHKDYEFAIFTHGSQIDIYRRTKDSFVRVRGLMNPILPKNVTWDHINKILVGGDMEEKSKLAEILYNFYIVNEK